MLGLGVTCHSGARGQQGQQGQQGRQDTHTRQVPRYVCGEKHQRDRAHNANSWHGKCPGILQQPQRHEKDMPQRGQRDREIKRDKERRREAK